MIKNDPGSLCYLLCKWLRSLSILKHLTRLTHVPNLFYDSRTGELFLSDYSLLSFIVQLTVGDGKSFVFGQINTVWEF